MEVPHLSALAVPDHIYQEPCIYLFIYLFILFLLERNTGRQLKAILFLFHRIINIAFGARKLKQWRKGMEEKENDQK